MDSVKAEIICAEALASVVSFISDERAYKKEYNRGWRASKDTEGALDRNLFATDAWQDGYFDYAGGRDKFHTMYCETTSGHNKDGPNYTCVQVQCVVEDQCVVEGQDRNGYDGQWTYRQLPASAGFTTNSRHFHRD